MQALTLLELNSLVRQVIESTMSREYWVEAELSECRESRGHCYMELVQKEEPGNTPIARAQAKCWRTVWTVVRPHFEHITHQAMRAGMKVRLKVYAQFHEAYGFSWIVTDIDPTFTLGDMARRRQEIIQQLKQEGVFDLQRDLSLPLFCQRIAVVSSESAAGYGDFCQQLNDSPFCFHTQLFPAIMQGEQVEPSIIGALNNIYLQADDFDVVVIIRGGGATADMSGFDTLALAENVAQFPLPIITGIGHDRDECVLDMVSHLRVKTPTAAAALLIERLQKVLERIETAEERLLHHVQTVVEMERLRLTRLSERIPVLFTLVSTRQQARIDTLSQRFYAAVAQRLEREQARFPVMLTQMTAAIERRLLKERHRLELYEQQAASLDPALLLKRGYSITLHQGKAVTNASQLHQGDEIVTRLSEGSVSSIVK